MILACDVLCNIFLFILSILLHQPSIFIILLGKPFYNSKSFISNKLASPFGRRFSHLSDPIKLSIKMVSRDSRSCYFHCQNFSLINYVEDELTRYQVWIESPDSGSIFSALGPIPSCNPTPAPAPVPSPTLTLVSSNKLFK